MPTVPYSPIPPVSPEGPSIPYRTDRGVSETAFGANIGVAIQRLGGQVEKTADTIEQRVLGVQQLNNQSDAKDADVNAALQIGNRTNQFYSLEGKNAQDAYPQYQEDIQKIRQNTLQGLNPAARRMADVSIARRMEFALIDAGRHTAQQDKAYADHTSDARIKLAQEDAGIDPYNEDRWNHNLDVIRSEVAGKAQQKGWGDDVSRQLGDLEIARAYKSRLTGIAMRDPNAAKEFYEQHKNDIKDNAIQQDIERMLIRQQNTIGTKIRADQITQGGDYFKVLERRESGGDRFAKAPTSSALGPYQITDATWDALRKDHPELQLTADGRTDQGQALKAIQTFTAENRDYLNSSGIDPNDKNTYMAHFLGAGTAVKFLRNMENNPGLPAISAGVTPKQVEANRSVFYAPDGRPRTVQEVFNNMTAKFGGPEAPLSGRSTGEWLQNALDQAEAIAAHDAPNDPEYKEMLQDRVMRRFNKAHQAARMTDQANFGSLYDKVIGGGDPTQNMKSIDDILNNPQLNEAYHNLPPEMKQRIIGRINANAKPDVHMTEDRIRTYQAAMGMAITDPTKFLSLDTSKMDLPWHEQDQIFRKQMAITQKTQNTTFINKALGDAVIKTTLRSVGFPPAKDDEGANTRYSQFVGAFNESLDEYAQKNNKPMPPEDQRKEAGRLLAEQSHSWFSGTTRTFQVPADFRKEWTEKFTSKLGHAPSEADWGAFYQHVVKRRAEDAAK